MADIKKVIELLQEAEEYFRHRTIGSVLTGKGKMP